MEFVLVSSCLIGNPVRYNGSHKRSESDVLRRWLTERRVVAVCPEIGGGLPVPRLPAEIAMGAGGDAVLAGRARVVDLNANDVTAEFVSGAAHALLLAQAKGIQVAVMKEGSPSCGSSSIYDGTFAGNRVQQQGVTAALLVSAGIRVFNEEQLEEASEFLRFLEMAATRQ